MPVNTNTLFAGEQLETNCRLKSTDGRFEFMLDQFGRIRVWDAGNVVWAASSGPAYGGRVTLQTDGHLVLRRADNTAIWTTNVYGFSDARLVLEDNGSLVVYRGDGQVAWSAGAAPPSPPATLTPGHKLSPGGKLRSPRGRYELIYRTDGNLVLYRLGQAVWSTKTVGKAAGEAALQIDGHFLLKSPDNTVYWKTGVYGFNDGSLALQDDGALVETRAGAVVAWTTPKQALFELSPGQALAPGDKLGALGGEFELVYQSDGNLVLYSAGKATWQSKTMGKPAGRAVLQTDGHFLLSSPDNTVYWKTGVYGFNDGRLVLLDDGRLVVYAGDDVRWETPRLRLECGQAMKPGNVLQSLDGRYQMRYQTDGNLVVYNQGRAVWQSKTAGKPAGVAALQGDGRLVVKGPDNAVLWQTSDSGYTGDSRLEITDTGVLALYWGDGVRWASRLDARMLAGQALLPRWELRSPNNDFLLRYQADGNLVLYYQGRAIWNAGTFGKPAGQAVLQADGNFMVKGPDEAVYWQSNVAGFVGAAKLALQDDGRLVVYEGDVARWSSPRSLLPSGYALNPGDELRSPNGQCELRYQVDGDLVLYFQEQAMWSTNTRGKPAGQAVMQTDGNLLVKGPDGVVYWKSNTPGNSGSRLELLDDYRLVLYCGAEKRWESPRSRLMPGYGLKPGDALQSPSGEYRVQYQADGNLVGYRQGQMSWSAGVTHSDPGQALLRTDGRFNLVTSWNSNYGGASAGPTDAPSRVELEDSGFLTLFAGDVVRWAAVLSSRLPATRALFPRESMRSPSGDTTLLYNGRLVLSYQGWTSWTSPPSHSGAGMAMVQPDGNLVLTGERGDVDWHVGASGYNGAVKLEVRDGGRLVLCWGDEVRWEPVRSRLLPGQALGPGEALKSPNGQFELRYEANGNLVVCRQGQVVWSTGTSGKPAGHAVLQSDGHFLLKSPDGAVYWKTNVYGFDDGRLDLQDNGLLIVYAGDASRWGILTGSRIVPGQVLPAGCEMPSANGQSTLRYELEGNLAIYRQGQVAWESGTHGNRAGKLEFTGDSPNFHLRLSDPDGVPYWVDFDMFNLADAYTMLDDGMLSGTRGGTPWLRTPRYFLNSGDTMAPGDVLSSPDGQYWLNYTLTMGLLTITKEGVMVWRADAPSTSSGQAILGSDGVLALKNSDNVTYWSSGASPGPGPARLTLTNSGELRLAWNGGAKTIASV